MDIEAAARVQVHDVHVPAYAARRGALRALAKPRGATALVIAPILALFIAYASQHVWLCDDAFISFRYARNLLLGHGLVFNVGERVEGYTNFLWVLELAGIWKAFGVPPEQAYLPLTALYTAGTFWVTWQLAKSTPLPRAALVASAAALFFLSINRNFVVWSGGGLETRQFTFLAVAAIWLMRDQSADRARSYAAASLCWACGELTRPEASMLFACGGVWLLARCLAERRWRLRELLAYCAPFALVVAAHFMFRIVYYGDVFPNTYYAKHVRPWPEVGIPYLTAAIIEGGLYLSVPLAVLGCVARLVLARDAVHGLSLLCILAHALYLVRLGGDHFELRPMDFYWPLLSVAAIDGLAFAARGLRRWLRRGLPERFAIGASWVFGAGAALALAVYCTVFQLAELSLTRELTRRDQTFKLFTPVTEQSVPLAFRLPGLSWLAPLYNEASRAATRQSSGRRYQEHKVLWQSRVAEYGPYQGLADSLFPSDAVMTVGPIGVIGYMLPNLTIIDFFGLTDRAVARNPVTRPNAERQLAHDRRPPPGYLKERGVNLEVLGASERFGPASQHALHLAERVWMPLLSPDPAWLRRAFAGPQLWWRELRPSLRRNRVWMAGKPYRPVRALGFFDRGLDGWAAQGEAMAEVAAARSQRTRSAVGASFVNSYHARLGDAAKGELLSPSFTPNAGDRLVFLLGGGQRSEVGVELRVDGRALSTWRGLDSNELAFISEDLSPHAGKACQIRIYDGADGPWGHVQADHFMLVRPSGEQ